MSLTPEQARAHLTTLINEVNEKLKNKYINPIASNRPVEDYEAGISAAQVASEAIDMVIALFKTEE